MFKTKINYCNMDISTETSIEVLNKPLTREGFYYKKNY